MLSARFAWAVAALLAFAAVPTVLNVYRPPPALAPGALDARLAAFGEPGPRKAEWVRETFGAEDFATRRCGPHELFAARAWDGKKLFHFPELALTYACTATAVRDLPGDPPVRVLEFGQGQEARIAAYALLYGRRGVARPIPFHLSILPELFLGRREPMTLLYVQGEAPAGREHALEEDLRALLARAVDALAR
jgi:hypothetical protein